MNYINIYPFWEDIDGSLAGEIRKQNQISKSTLPGNGWGSFWKSGNTFLNTGES